MQLSLPYLFLLQAGGALSPQLFLIAGIFLIMYFFMIRPQTKRLQEQKTFIANLKKGDRIVTTGGIHARIMRVDEKTFLIEIDKNVTVSLDKSFIAVDQSRLLATPATAPATTDQAKS